MHGRKFMARITVVDDYADFLDMVAAILHGLNGHEVAGLDGREATIDDLVASDPDLLIVDLLTGAGATSDLSAVVVAGTQDRLSRVPVIICSGDVDSLNRRSEEFATAGMVTLQKPFAIEQLITAVFQALNGCGRHGRPTGGTGTGLLDAREADELRAVALDAAGP
jgi:DNA-binding NtrC family response regulator